MSKNLTEVKKQYNKLCEKALGVRRSLSEFIATPFYLSFESVVKETSYKEFYDPGAEHSFETLEEYECETAEYLAANRFAKGGSFGTLIYEYSKMPPIKVYPHKKQEHLEHTSLFFIQKKELESCLDFFNTLELSEVCGVEEGLSKKDVSILKAYYENQIVELNFWFKSLSETVSLQKLFKSKEKLDAMLVENNYQVYDNNEYYLKAKELQVALS